MAEPDRLDVHEVMREVQRRARQIEASEALEPSPLAPGAASDLATVHELSDLNTVAFDSPRALVGPVVVGFKRSLARLLTPVLHRQSVLNGAVARLFAHFGTRMSRAEAELELQAAEIADVRAELRRSVTGLQQRVLLSEARLAQWRRTPRPPRSDGDIARDADRRSPDRVDRSPTARREPDSTTDSYDHLLMQQRFRGSEALIKSRQQVYLPHFVDHPPVLDIGCGRGEFLELLRDAGVEARGVELDDDAVLLCKDKGLEVVGGDAFSYLAQLADGSLGGIFCAQLVEHLRPADVVRLTRLCARKLRRGGIALFETPNPTCLTVFAGAFYADFTHVWPYHPDVLAFVLELAGFEELRTIFSSPVDPEARMPELRDRSVFGAETDGYNRAARLVNQLLLGPQDYAVVGRKGIDPP